MRPRGCTRKGRRRSTSSRDRTFPSLCGVFSLTSCRRGASVRRQPRSHPPPPHAPGTSSGGAAVKGTEWRRLGGEGDYANCSWEASSRGGFPDDGGVSSSNEDSHSNSVPLTREHDTMQHGSLISQRLPLPCDEPTQPPRAQNPVSEQAVSSALGPQASASSERLCFIKGDVWSCSSGASYHVSGRPVRAPSPHPEALQRGGGCASRTSVLSTDTRNEERSLQIKSDLNDTP